MEPSAVLIRKVVKYMVKDLGLHTVSFFLLLLLVYTSLTEGL